MILDGKALAATLTTKLGKAIAQWTKAGRRPPGLAVFLVGDDLPSQIYVARKQKACLEVGIYVEVYRLPAATQQNDLLEAVARCNASDAIDGILIQMPLPHHIDAARIIAAVDPKKDVDGFHPENMGRLLLGSDEGFVPCTPLGIQKILQENKIPLAGQHVVIVGRSNIVGKPLAALLMQKKEGANATVTVLHSASKHSHEIMQTADILVAAIGSPEFIQSHHVKEGATIIDVGINRIQDTSAKGGYRLVGDVAFSEVAPRCHAITPVPGGVGPMTIAMLLNNTALSYKGNFRLDMEV